MTGLSQVRTPLVASVLIFAASGCGARQERVWPQPPAPVIATVPDTVQTIDEQLPTAAMTPLETAEGEATYYASYFDGRLTASGIPFSNGEYYAAHRTYPFGTLLRVTNLDNQRSVLVHVVDRGPSDATARGRATIIDLSQRAADELDFISAGRIRVRLEVLQWGR